VGQLAEAVEAVAQAKLVLMVLHLLVVEMVAMALHHLLLVVA
jgi:hypothetical protein